ncbi:hypothetical protein CLOM_g24410 [Closterium sp. NIES-68]|nr:hypothetical protein CLOM_g24410 [Closterium sp. NIES-68]
MAQQQAPNMQNMAPAGAYVAPPPPYAAAVPAPAGTPDGCCANNKRSALYTWLPLSLRIGIFLCIANYRPGNQPVYRLCSGRQAENGLQTGVDFRLKSWHCHACSSHA